MRKCHGQTRMYGARDDNGLPILCCHWLKLCRDADQKRRQGFHRRGGMGLVMAVAGLGMGR